MANSSTLAPKLETTRVFAALAPCQIENPIRTWILGLVLLENPSYHANQIASKSSLCPLLPIKLPFLRTREVFLEELWNKLRASIRRRRLRCILLSHAALLTLGLRSSSGLYHFSQLIFHTPRSKSPILPSGPTIEERRCCRLL